MTGKFKCTAISRQAFNDEKVTLEHAEATVILHNRSAQGAFVVGKEYPVTIGPSTKSENHSGKKTSAKKDKSK